MPGAFLISVAQSALPAEAPRQGGPASVVAELFRGSGAPAARVEDVYWSGALPPEALAAGLPACLPLALVQRGGYAVQQALHSAAQAILAGDADLALAGGTAEHSGYPEGLATAALLASPQAVGRYNLFPQAEVVARVALGVDVQQAPAVAALEQALRRAGAPLEELYAAAVARPARPLVDELKGAGLKRVKPGGLPELLATLRGGAAKKKAGRRGLLASLDAQGTLLATVIEVV